MACRRGSRGKDSGGAAEDARSPEKPKRRGDGGGGKDGSGSKDAVKSSERRSEEPQRARGGGGAADAGGSGRGSGAEAGGSGRDRADRAAGAPRSDKEKDGGRERERERDGKGGGSSAGREGKDVSRGRGGRAGDKPRAEDAAPVSKVGERKYVWKGRMMPLCAGTAGQGRQRAQHEGGRNRYKVGELKSRTDMVNEISRGRRDQAGDETNACQGAPPLTGTWACTHVPPPPHPPTQTS
jgi:hypothetical protein